MVRCPHCEGETEVEYRYCPWCAASQRRKLVEFFRGADADSRRALRVSRYLPEKRVRFSVWDETGRVRAAVSLDEDEAARLGAFVAAPAARRPRLLDDLRALVRR
jgi:sarcosine oxidase delta subunit